MKVRNSPLWLLFEHVVPWLVLATLLTYSYAKFFRHSYGFRVSPGSGLVVSVFDQQPEPTLRADDRILQFGSVQWEKFQSDLSMPFFVGYQPGDTVPLKVERDGETIDIAWKYPDFNQAEFFDQLNSEWWISYAFWLAGVLTILLVRPKDTSWLLMALFNFLTAIWLIAGSGLSAYQIWYSGLVLRVVVWLCLPVYLHLHWVFPRPLGNLPAWLVGLVYGVGVLFAIAQALQLLPAELYLLAFLVAIGGSLILLLIHIWRQPSIRRDFRLPLIVLILAVAPAMIWAALATTVGIPESYGGAGLLSLPLLPLAYLYTAFRRRLGNLELRVNRFFTIYMFVILFGVIGLLIVAFLDTAVDFPGKAITIGFTSALMTAAAFIWAYPPFERGIDQRIFGVSHTSKRLLEIFSTNITTSVSQADLIHVLQEEVFASLLIRQFAFLHFDQGSLNVVSRMGLDTEQLPEEKDVPDLLARSGFYRSPDLVDVDQPYGWILLVLPLKLGDKLMGFWLLGRRDPDDFYSQQEILTLGSLANLTAIALSNILQTGHLKTMYEANIGRYEQERLRLSRDLHDSILNEMAALLIRSDAPVFSREFQQAFEALTERLREIVSDLRPPTLNFGLKYALEDLADKLSERNQGSVMVEPHVQTEGEWHYPDLVEHHAYRIVQEACGNALKYAHAKTIRIVAGLSQESFNIQVEDDGIGFHMETGRKLNEMLVKKHFGLVGMLERANLIGAEVDIDSKPGAGTCIRVLWKSKESI